MLDWPPGGCFLFLVGSEFVEDGTGPGAVLTGGASLIGSGLLRADRVTAAGSSVPKILELPPPG
eukprot:CAMPEP_0202975330 /NCGR_PEP_ID=MMETSP1396-20130829/68175_1 /ASSEMBLY_ACC=CAM_ASM_000872 /TAXON_ID= /ORGANISM="Pseudokeronopsis sp., Strain Brazil" /LENGTH=63 /DNA_ID=CAMNT_0049710733 /DNA_START=71 /DNA_END=258 /DNA_ORIENTATION=+